ncbi:DUF5345 family protein [Paenibacillus sp. sgz500958]|uniref:DUF5345 family protein n=1 Tax=Paenibacillus sp. sgz500958 TaxID=3242475 RepID=UPI0036D29F90
MKNDGNKVQDPLIEKLTLELERLDHMYAEITPPSLSALTKQIEAEAVKRRTRMRNELLLFLLLAVVLVGTCLTLLNAAPLAYLALQGIIPVVALGVAAISRMFRKERVRHHE